MGADRSSVYSSLLSVLDGQEQSLNQLRAESSEETDAVRGMLLRLLEHLVDWEAVDLPGPHDASALATRLCDLALPDGRAMKLYYEGLRERHPAQRDLVPLMRAVLSSHRERCEGLSLAFPRLHAPLASCLELCLSLDMPGVDEEGLQGLEGPAVLAFAFGTGRKIGPAASLPALVGPACETPGRANCALAAAVAALLALRPMPVFAQWEVADALLHGSEGCPPELAAGFLDFDFGRYPLEGRFAGCAVHKALPSWPGARGAGQRLEDMDAGLIGRHYLSTAGVMEQFGALWAARPELRPRSLVVVGFPDHAGRCLAVAGAGAGLGAGRVVCAPARCYPSWDAHGCNAVTGYDPESTQPWTTSRARFLAKELHIRLHMGVSAIS